ncbi:hypothetical protein [Ramlibacter sp.]|uniref:hypothetical protein n=1 Tax=Ramlibacter sp. TaxID=1917967 RepID=UPI003D13A999
MIRSIKLLAGVLLALGLAACGGGGGSAGTTSGTQGSSSIPAQGTATASVTDFAMFTDKTTINNSGSDKATLTVQAVDTNRNVVAGATVAVAANSNGVFTSLATDNKTDATGAYRGELQIGSDKSDRDITLAVTVNGITKQSVVRVAGSKLTLQAVPSAPAPGEAVVLTASLVDSSNNPIPNIPIRLGGTIPALAGTVITTDIAGRGTRSFAAPTTAAIYTISASGNGTNSTDYQVQVFSTSVPAATIPAGSAPSLSSSPNVLSVNAPNSSTNKSLIRFLFIDPTNKPITNVRVRFVDATTGIAAVGASLASGTQTLFTDASGTVTTQYIAGQNSSPTNGVTVRACYSANDFANATDCPNSVTTSLTVAGTALAVSVGDDNLLVKSGQTYIKKFSVTVADSAGRAVPNAAVDISVDLTHYGKGAFLDAYTVAVPTDASAYYPSSSTTPTTTRVFCINEDLNRNGNVDPSENLNGSVDSNGQPTLEPRRSDLIISYVDPTKTTTDATGVLDIQVQYAQVFATWLAYKIRATANVAGSQGNAERTFVTDAVADDLPNGAFRTPPYGTGACNSAN